MYSQSFQKLPKRNRCSSVFRQQIIHRIIFHCRTWHSSRGHWSGSFSGIIISHYRPSYLCNPGRRSGFFHSVGSIQGSLPKVKRANYEGDRSGDSLYGGICCADQRFLLGNFWNDWEYISYWSLWHMKFWRNMQY